MISTDPNWLGGTRAALSTEGNDFWLTFMNNNMINPEDPANKNNPEFKFEMKVALSAREEMDIVIAAGSVVIETVHVHAGATLTYTIDNNSYAKDIYLFESEVQKYQGVHVYAAEGSKDKVFSCFLYSRDGGTGLSSRDASLVMPTRLLGKEYIVQTYPEDLKSTQLAIVATEDNTTVKIVPTFNTYGGKTTAGSTITLTNLSKGEAYLVASKEHEGEDFVVDLSGTTICSDKPIAVFNGNQQTGIPNREAYSQDFMVEQSIPIEQWGTEFYLTNLENTRINYALVTAAYADTKVEIVTYNAETGSSETNSVLLDKAGKTTPPIAINDSKRKEVIIRSVVPGKPILCYHYITSAAVNEFCTSTAFDDICYAYGDPASAMMPAWTHRVQSMNMFTEPLDPQGGANTPQHFFAYVITRTEDTDKLTLNGGTVTATFYRFHANNDLSYAHIPLPNTSSYHLIESSGDGFIGTVYGLTDAQGYYYTLGFKPPQPHDSIYVTNTNEIMSRGSYDMDSLDGHGWYQRQWNEWIEGKERLDTAIICDSMSVSWAVETPAEKPIEKIEWAIYDVTGVKGAENGKIVKGFPINGPITGNKQEYEYQFILPEEDIEDRHQFFEYEVQAVLYRDQLMCGGEDIDTLKTTVRVTRQFNDTLYRIVCLGDTLRFFHDSMPDQRDLSILGDHAEGTRFVTVKKGEGEGYVEPWVYKLESGKRYTFHRDYQTQAGCDSLVTLEVFVCDTFRFVDTIHLCDNQDTLYHGKIFRGEKSKSAFGGEVIKKDTVLLVKFKTEQCACQQEEGFPTFNGCDSIYELHLFIHPTYYFEKTDTMCYNENPDSLYKWPIQYGSTDRTIGLKDTIDGSMKWDAAAQAWIGTFRDTMFTQTCAECNGGLKGCDSIHALTLIIPKAYYFNDTATWCKLHYDPVLGDTVHQFYQWIGKDHSGRDSIRGELRETNDYYDRFTTRYGCDSVYHIRLDYLASAELYERTDTTICSVQDGIFEWKDHNGVVLKTYPLDKPAFFDEYDDSRCDTVYAINLTVIPSYYIVDTVMKTQEDTCYWPVTGMSYGGTKTTLPYDSLITTDTTFVVRHFLTNPVNGVQCDSTHVLFLRIGSVFRDTVSAFACGTETSYDWIETRPEYYPDGVPFLRKTITDLPDPRKDSVYEDRYLTTLGYDSIFYLRLYRAPSYLEKVEMSVCQDTIEQFKWDGHPDVAPFSLKDAGTFILQDKQKTDSFECDSTWLLYLTVNPIYADTTPVYNTCQFSTFRWEDQDPSFVAPDSILDADNNRVLSIPTDHAGDFIYDLKFHTIHGCDSTRYLKLHIDSVYTLPVETTERSMCDNEVLPFFDRFIYGVNAPNRPLDPDSVVAVPAGKSSFTFDTTYTATSELGCDSAVLHRITIYRTYLKEELDSVCQGTVYSWHDIVIQTETLKSDSIYVFYDSLHTTEHGCDSIHVLRLRIDSVYHIYNNKLLCDYDTTSWQGQYYRGEKFVGTAAEKAKYNIVVKSDTTYLDTVIWNTIHKCDSIFYLTLRVAPSYDTTVYDTVCDNENRHIFIFRDTQGNYFRDSIGYEPHMARAERDTSTTHYPTVRHTLHHTLKTVEGCDSVVHFELTIKPTYLFENKGKGCFGETIIWRGKEISSSNVYYDRLTTQDGCDSVFKLDYFIKPFISIPIHKEICDNYSFYHYDTLFRDDGSIRIVATEVWSPGRPRPDVDDPVDVHFPGTDGCDSIVYKYYLTFHHAYLFNDSAKAPICSGEAYYSDCLNHEWSNWVHEYDVDTFVQPYDTLFLDSLFTQFGCDSVYRLKAHVLPSYRHIEYDTICSNEEYVWHSILHGDSLLSGLTPGVYQFCDSFYTIDHCDSIYEMRLLVNTAYFEEDNLQLCADETLQWRNHYFEHMTPGEYFVADSLTSELGCDSIYHLYLTVVDTTFEINLEQICIGDTLVVGEHHYTQDGWYKDTTLNDAGCRHFIYTHIEVIPPTVPTIWVENAMCQSETAFELQYTYTSARPISYSVYFDEKGYEAGFEDLEDIPITAYSDTMVISIPIPYRDGDKTQYPKPDLYPIRLVVDNGICQHKETDCSADSCFLLSYPKWILEQRHGDVIAILNEKYNGGYSWTSYRWYEDGILMPEQTKPYLHLPDGLVPGAAYHVELQRDGEELSFPTCAIEAHANVIDNDFAPTMGYLSVTPTYVCTAHPYTYILSRKDGSYRVTSAEGMFVSEGVFHADVTEIEVPQKEGMYIVQLWSNETPEEPYRAIKILVNSKCIE